jgi:hypothetical protein
MIKSCLWLPRVSGSCEYIPPDLLQHFLNFPAHGLRRSSDEKCLNDPVWSYRGA